MSTGPKWVSQKVPDQIGRLCVRKYDAGFDIFVGKFSENRRAVPSNTGV